MDIIFSNDYPASMMKSGKDELFSETAHAVDLMLAALGLLDKAGETIAAGHLSLAIHAAGGTAPFPDGFAGHESEAGPL